MPDPLAARPRPCLEVAIRDQVGALALDVNFQSTAPWTVLFGPSGSGKTTLLRSIAGFRRPAHGVIALHQDGSDPVVLFDQKRGLNIAGHRRPVRIAAQRSTLFPRRTVAENVRYGVGDRFDLAEQTLDRLHLKALAGSRVERLSGGEAQRVSVARAIAAALANGPGTWLLFDEPFTGIDLRFRAEITRGLRAWLRELGHPVLSVTHDVAEVFALDAEVIRIDAGRVIAQGPPREVLREERELALAALRSVVPDPAAVSR